jgi:hypothetical protein
MALTRDADRENDEEKGAGPASRNELNSRQSRETDEPYGTSSDA